MAAAVAPTAGSAVAPGVETVYGRPPGLGRRILRGMLWGVPYGQWWTLWTVFSELLWQHTFPNVGAVIVMAIVFGFFGSLAGLIIGAANATFPTGMAIGVGVGLLVCGLEVLLTHDTGGLVNVVFYFFTGRFVGIGITRRVQQPILTKSAVSGATI